MTDTDNNGLDGLKFFHKELKKRPLVELEQVIAAAVSQHIGIPTKCSISALEISAAGYAADLALKVSDDSANPF